jgi:nucleotidyltransferase/DNA polymerase involved in DNA repair
VRVACAVLVGDQGARLRPRAWAACLDALEGFTATVEAGEPGVAYADITLLELHYNDPAVLGRLLQLAVMNRSGVLPQVGIADAPFAARMAAQAAPPGRPLVWPAGAAASRLSWFHLNVLPIDAATRQTMNHNGIVTLGDLTRLSVTEVQTQFGLAGRRAYRLARGEAERPLRPRRAVERESSRQSFETPVYDPLRLRALATIQVRDLAERLRARGLRCARLRFTGELATENVRQTTRANNTTTSLSRITDEALLDWPVAQGVIALTVALDTAPQSAEKETVLRFRTSYRPAE